LNYLEEPRLSSFVLENSTLHQSHLVDSLSVCFNPSSFKYQKKKKDIFYKKIRNFPFFSLISFLSHHQLKKKHYQLLSIATTSNNSYQLFYFNTIIHYGRLTIH
jgi:hypothetical protein